MDSEQIFENLKAAIIEGDDEKARASSKEAVESGISPLEAVEKGLSKGMAVVGDRFETGEAYLPELLMASETFNAAMEVLKPEIEKQKQSIKKIGTILIATVKGDHHSIGKNIVSTVLETNGFEVVDIGIDKAAVEIIEAAEKNNVDVIGLSSVMTTTMPMQKEVIDTLVEFNKRDNFLVIIGGGPVNEKWANEIGADGYGATAIDAVEVSKSLLQKER